MHYLLSLICKIIHQHTYYIAFLFALCFQMCIDLRVPLDQLPQDLWLPGIPHCFLSIEHFEVRRIMFSPGIPGTVDSRSATRAENINSTVHVLIRPHQHRNRSRSFAHATRTHKSSGSLRRWIRLFWLRKLKFLLLWSLQTHLISWSFHIEAFSREFLHLWE